jgi:HSP20 family protein
VLDLSDHFLITLDVPGMTARNFQVLILPDRILQISGENHEEHAVPLLDGGRRIERNHNTFSKSYSIPHSADLDKVNSYVENGRLCVRIAKHLRS